MNSFDLGIIHFLNQFAQRSHFFDYFVATVSGNVLITAALFASLLWWGWFRNDARDSSPEKTSALTQDRQIVITGIILCFATLIVARALAVTLPFRERPFRTPALHFRMPFGSNPEDLFSWSAFPSDHAAFLFALGMVVFCLSRKLGVATWCYAFLASCLPRVYFGLHYPTDILAGAAIGAAIGSFIMNRRLRAFLSAPALRWVKSSPQTFYPCLFITTFLFATMFSSLRLLATASLHAVRDVIHHHH